VNIPITDDPIQMGKSSNPIFFNKFDKNVRCYDFLNIFAEKFGENIGVF
jgi:hypothetical protein